MLGAECWGGGEATCEDEGWAEHLAAVVLDVLDEAGEGREVGAELGFEAAGDIFEGLRDEALHAREVGMGGEAGHWSSVGPGMKTGLM